MTDNVHVLTGLFIFKMIFSPQVFGVDDNQDYNRPVINEKQKDLIKGWALSSAAVTMEEKKALNTPGFHNAEVPSALDFPSHMHRCEFPSF